MLSRTIICINALTALFITIFLSNLESIDTEMATILRDNWDELIAIVQQGERNAKARGEFNTQVAIALDSLVKLDEPKDGRSIKF